MLGKCRSKSLAAALFEFASVWQFGWQVGAFSWAEQESPQGNGSCLSDAVLVRLKN